MITLNAIDVDNIYQTADSGYWGEFQWVFKLGLEDDAPVMMFQVTERDDGNEYMMTASILAKAIETIIEGKVLNSYLTGMCASELQEWQDDPEYGVPFDAELCDAIVQIACFGELVYG